MSKTKTVLQDIHLSILKKKAILWTVNWGFKYKVLGQMHSNSTCVTSCIFKIFLKSHSNPKMVQILFCNISYTSGPFVTDIYHARVWFIWWSNIESHSWQAKCNLNFLLLRDREDLTKHWSILWLDSCHCIWSRFYQLAINLSGSILLHTSLWSRRNNKNNSESQ